MNRGLTVYDSVFVLTNLALRQQVKGSENFCTCLHKRSEYKVLYMFIRTQRKKKVKLFDFLSAFRISVPRMSL